MIVALSCIDFYLCFRYLYFNFNNFFFFCSKYILKIIINYCNFFIYIYHSYYFYNFFFFLAKSSLFKVKSLLDFTLIDYLFKDFRFECIYICSSLEYNIKYYINFSINIYQVLATLSHLYFAANWLEREVYDMFGCWFINHPNFKRILTDYGFKGFPLRKDFPLIGYYDIFFNISSVELNVDFVNISQFTKLTQVTNLFSYT